MPIIDPQSNQNKELSSEKPAGLVFSISRFHLIRHIIALILTVFLGFSLFMSELLRYIAKPQSLHVNQTIFPYLLLLFFIAIIAITAILSVRKLQINTHGLEISNLFWQEKVNWQDIKSYKAPKYLRFALLKTKLCLYLIIKREFKNYAELEQAVKQYIDIKN